MRFNSIVEVERKIEDYFKCINSPHSGIGALIVNVRSMKNYRQLKAYLENRVKTLCVSCFCENEDEFPNWIRMLEEIKNCNDKLAIFGLLENSVFCGQENVYSIINTILYELNKCSKAVFLFYSGDVILNEFIKNDGRLKNNIILLNDKSDGSIECMFLGNININNYNMCDGYKSLLASMEIKQKKKLMIKTELANYISKNYSNCFVINSAYKLLTAIDLLPEEINEEYGSNEQWSELCKRIEGKSFNRYIIDQYGDISQIERCLGDWKIYTEFEKWLLWLTLKTSKLKTSYIKFVMQKCSNIEEFEMRYADAILDLEVPSKSFYKERRMRISSILNDITMREFIKKAEVKGNDIIFYLTDEFEVEREAIIKWCSLQKVLTDSELILIKNAYPMLYNYLDQYNYKNKMFNDYFYHYKISKVINTINDNFLSLVNDIAIKRPYNELQTRNQVFEGIDKDKALVLFIDALGLEYMSIISYLCKKNNLTFDMSIVRTNIPSTTAKNKFFLEGVEREPDYRLLDKLKHNGITKYSYEKTKLPIHITRELECIEEIINLVLEKLNDCEKVIIVTDHGASRLAVINQKKQTYVVDSKVSELGRCCEYYKGIEELEIPYWIKDDEDEYCVLANYDRFSCKGAPAVETHGGATLEEVAIPIIIFKKKSEEINIQIVGSKEIQFMFKQKCVVKFYISKHYDNIQLRIGNDYYDCQFDGYHWNCKTNLKRSGKYIAQVYSDGNKIGEIDFILIKSIKENDMDI